VRPWLWCVPVVDARRAEFLNRLHVHADDVLVIDNTATPGIPTSRFPRRVGTGLNHGCARSWNLGAKAAIADRRPGVIFPSPSVVLGEPGGLDVVDVIEDQADEWGAFFAGLGWHMHAWRVDAFDRVGFFDERIYPVYFEDDDWLRRVRLAGGGDRRGAGAVPEISIDATMGASGQSIEHLQRDLDLGHLGAYYREKWGGLPDSETYETPYNLDVGLGWWPGHSYAGTPGMAPTPPPVGP